MLRAVQYLFRRKVPTMGRFGRLTDHPHPLDTQMSQRRVPAVLAALVSVLWAACSGHGASPKTNVAPAAEGGGPGPGITAADLRQRLYAFSDDSMLGREAGTLGNVKGTNDLAAEAAKLGLRPAGDSGTFFQTVPLVLHRPDPASKLAANGAPLVLGRDFVVLPSFGGLFGASFDAAGTQAIYAGRLGDANQSLSTDLTAGKIVVFDAPLGADGRPSGQLRGRDALARYSNAAAIAIAILDYVPAQMSRRLSQPQTEVAGTEAPTESRPLGLLITQRAATQMLGAPFNSLQAGSSGQTISGMVRMVDTPTAAPARNVVAIYPGSDPAVAGEYVAIGGHNDHLGIDDHASDHDSARAALIERWRIRGLDPEGPVPTPTQIATLRVNVDSLHRLRRPRRDSIYNGADDDGSGSVSVLEIAQQFVRAPDHPRRSILFVWHTGEEKGLLGSQYFTDNPTISRDSIVAQLNMDMVGRGDSADIKGGGPRYLELVGSRRLSTELGDLVESVNRTEPMPFVFDYQFDANGHPENIYCRSDHYEYARYGIPIVFFTTGLHEDYHQITDEAQYIDYDHMARVDKLVYDIALKVADLDHRVVVDKAKPDPHGQCRQ